MDYPSSAPSRLAWSLARFVFAWLTSLKRSLLCFPAWSLLFVPCDLYRALALSCPFCLLLPPSPLTPRRPHIQRFCHPSIRSTIARSQTPPWPGSLMPVALSAVRLPAILSDILSVSGWLSLLSILSFTLPPVSVPSVSALMPVALSAVRLPAILSDTLSVSGWLSAFHSLSLFLLYVWYSRASHLDGFFVVHANVIQRFTSLATNPLGGISRLMDAGRSNLSSLFQFVLATSFVRAVLDSGLRLWQATGEKLVEDVDLKSDLEAEGGVIDTSRQLWNEAVVKVKEGAAKTQEYIREKAVELKPHYEETAERTRLVIAQSTEEMKRQAEKAKEVIVSTAKVVAEQGKEGLAQVVESTPQPIKEIAEVAVTAHSSERSKSGAAIHDFCLGIPYGTVLVAGGIFWFIVVGSTNALRFGVGLGGILLASSILSLRAWKAARSSTPFIATSQVISLAIAITEWRRFAVTRAVFPTFFTALFSLGMAVFYAYILLAGGNPPKKSHADATPAPSVSSVVEAPST